MSAIDQMSSDVIKEMFAVLKRLRTGGYIRRELTSTSTRHGQVKTVETAVSQQAGTGDLYCILYCGEHLVDGKR